MSKGLNWSRYHQLLDIQAKRRFTNREQDEFATFSEEVERLNQEEYERCRPALEAHIARHEIVLDSIRKLTEALEKKFKPRGSS